MKLPRFTLTGLVLVLTLLYCGKKEESKQAGQENVAADTSLPTQVAPSEFSTVKLRLSYKKGDRYVFRLSSETDQSQTVGNQSQTISILTDYLFTHEVVDVQGENSVILRIRCDSVRVEASSAMGKVAYSSNVPGDSLKGKQPPFVEHSSLAGNEFYLKITNRGEIIDIYRLDKIMERLLGSVGPQIDSRTKGMLRDQFVKGFLRGLLQEGLQLLPQEPVGIDSGWSKVNKEVIEGLDMKSTARYKLTSAEKKGDQKTAVIDAKLETTIAGKKDFERQGLKYALSSSRISGSGTSRFDLNRMCVLSRDLNISTMMKFKITGQLDSSGTPSSADYLQKMNQTTHVRLVN
jgi:hypothetical protein